MDYTGHYINLDRCPDRRAAMEAELARHNLTGIYTRFAAADGNILNFPNPHLQAGHMGCWTSHYMLLQQNRDKDRHLHLVEDDVIFSSVTQQAIHWAIDSGYLDTFDIFYTDVFVPLRNEIYKVYKTIYDRAVTRNADGSLARVAFEPIDLRQRTWASTSSFLVSRKSLNKVYDLFDRELRQGARWPIDLFIRKMNFEGALNVGCIFPFVTSVRLENSLLSSVDARDDRQPEVAADIARYAFFIGCDWNLVRSYMDKYVPPPPADDRLAHLLGNLLAYSITDKYRFF
jgi:GR25 family glycosyltransferase involved in LPS biosynthesis